jgi:putative tryptophan/tyrosine transport system substrate-binding protein
MDRRRFLLTSVAGAIAAPLAAEAQQAGKVYRIGYLSTRSSTAAPVAPFRQGLRALGWIEGQNIVLDYRFADGRFDRLHELAAELVRLKVDVIVAGPTPAAAAAKNATATIPIVGIALTDPVGIGLVASLERPGGNVTGLSYSVGAETYGKALDLLKVALPKVRRVAVLSNPTNPGQRPAITTLKAAARSLGVQLQLLEAQGPNEFSTAFAAMAKEHVGALLVMADWLFNDHGARLADLAIENRLPSMYGVRENVEAGGLMSYGPNLLDIYRRAGTYVDKILKGAKPADLPVEQPTKFELVINAKTAKALGLTIPPALLARADQVID